jgi:hypothetical protein
MTMQPTVERWGLFDLACTAVAEGNPFDVRFGATFRYQHRAVQVSGFYDGSGVYRVRFMPDTEGLWSYETFCDLAGLNGVTGEFRCTPPSAGNRGPVAVAERYHFRYADGSPYYQIGTTCYAWAHQGEALEQQTLRTLATAPFNKMRMCVFPKHYRYNANEPEFFPFERQTDGAFDWTRFDPAFWRHFERRVADLQALGVEADLILFHPYDRWGFSEMPPEADERYLRYAVARLAAYRNVWWSFANEYDLMRTKSMADWDRFFRLVQAKDPYQRLRSIHNCRGFYDHAQPWVTHQSIQHRAPENTVQWREQYGKPVVIDETQYEGNIPESWGSLTPEMMVSRFWEGAVRGGYVGHGETYLDAADELWWSKGGVLRGQSAPRLHFLAQVLARAPQRGYDPVAGGLRSGFAAASKGQDLYLVYCSHQQPGLLQGVLPDDADFAVEVLDTWNMTCEARPGTVSGQFQLPLPTRPWMAALFTRVEAP